MAPKEYLDRTKERSVVHAMRGKYASSRGTRLITGAMEAYDRDGTFLFKVIKSSMKKAVRDRLVSLTYDCVSTNINKIRGSAAGPLLSSDIRGNERQISGHVKVSTNGFRSNKPVHSCVVGMNRTKKLSLWTQQNLGVIEDIATTITNVDIDFKTALPDIYSDMVTKSTKLPWKFTNSVFSSITVNMNFRTGIHMDNNSKNTYSAMVVAGDAYKGCYLVFPEYNVSVDLVPGDLIVFDSRLYHGNSPIKKAKGANRFSFVFYQK